MGLQSLKPQGYHEFQGNLEGLPDPMSGNRQSYRGVEKSASIYTLLTSISIMCYNKAIKQKSPVLAGLFRKAKSVRNPIP